MERGRRDHFVNVDIKSERGRRTMKNMLYTIGQNGVGII